MTLLAKKRDSRLVLRSAGPTVISYYDFGLEE